MLKDLILLSQNMMTSSAKQRYVEVQNLILKSTVTELSWPPKASLFHAKVPAPEISERVKGCRQWSSDERWPRRSLRT